MPAMVPSARREVIPEMNTSFPAAALIACEKCPLGWRSLFEIICFFVMVGHKANGE
jgi:hypothetical protein